MTIIIYQFLGGNEHHVQCQTNYENNMGGIRFHPTPSIVLKNKMLEIRTPSVAKKKRVAYLISNNFTFEIQSNPTLLNEHNKTIVL